MTARLPDGQWRTDLRLLADESTHPDASWGDTQIYASGFRQALVNETFRVDADLGVDAGLALDQLDLIRDGYWSRDLAAAVDRVGGHFPNGALHYFHAHQLMGWSNALAGTVFEETVANLANHGKITLPNGADHVVLGGRTQAAWDLSLMHGNDVVGHAQVKFSSDAQTIIQHLHDHADVPIVIANHEAAIVAAHHGIHVIDAGVPYDALHDHVTNEVATHLDLAHLVHEWVPEIALVMIVIAAARKLREGDKPETVYAWTKDAALKAGVANAVGTLVALSPHGLVLRLPSAMFTRFTMDRLEVADFAASRATFVRDNLRKLEADLIPARLADPSSLP